MSAEPGGASAPASDPQSERLGRDLSLAYVPFLLALFASGSLPWYHGRSAFDELGREPAGSLLGLLHFGAPLVAAAITASRALRGMAPKPASFVLLTIPEIFKIVGAGLLMITIVWNFHMRAETVIALVAIPLFASVAALGLWRGKRGEGWTRWSYLLAAMGPWHVFVASGLFFEMRDRQPERGIWLYMLAAAALLPLTIRSLLPRRA